MTLRSSLAEIGHNDHVGFPPVEGHSVGYLLIVEFEAMYQAMDSRDRRFDGRFFVAVKTTGIYCRPVCPAPTPRRQNTSFFRYAAVAELAGFRPCRRCRPELSPDTAEWDTRADLVGRALRLIAHGVADEGGVAGIARRLGVSERHLLRIFKAEVGATPGAVARSRRARLARQLLAESDMTITDVAFASGFRSVRAFNETIQKVYRLTPSEVRRGVRSSDGPLRLSLQYRPPLAVHELLCFLHSNAVPGVEEVDESSYRRTIQFGGSGAVIELKPSQDAVHLTIETDQIDSLAPVIQGSRQLMDLDADPQVIEEQLRRSPPLSPLVSARPGLRLVGSYDPFQIAVQAILARGGALGIGSKVAGRLAARFGRPVSRPVGSLTHVFPGPDQLGDADLESAGVPATKAASIRSLAGGLNEGRIAIDGSMDVGEATRALRAVPGLGAATVSMIAFRALRDPDAFPLSSSVEIRASGLNPEVISTWRPWRGYAAMHLWSAGLLSGLG